LCRFCHVAVHQMGAIVSEQLPVVRDLVMLEQRLFATGAPLARIFHSCRGFQFQ